MYHETKSLFGDAALEEIRRKEESMSTVRIGPNHQVTIPQDVLKKLEVGVGDSLQADVEEGKLVLTPTSAPALAPEEETLLRQTKRKIARIRKDLSRSRGLTCAEADIAVRARLIPSDQRWWWTEGWQAGERQADRDIKAGRAKVYETADQLLKDLRKR